MVAVGGFRLGLRFRLGVGGGIIVGVGGVGNGV